ncbi:MAG: transporter [Bacteroides sp.]|nr:transporter [Bacteroides sp.]
MIKLIRNWALPISILLGILGQSVFIHFSFLTPYFIFAMLFLTYCKINLSDIRLRQWHFWLLIIQLFASLVSYFALREIDNLIAQSMMLCIICPTATAASVITMKLGGNASSIATYTLLSNALAAMFIPIVFPLVEIHDDMGFMSSIATILSKVLPVLILPFVVSLILRWISPKTNTEIGKHSGMAFYLWALSLIIVTAKTTNWLINSDTSGVVEIGIGIASLIVCVLQFIIGRKLGKVYGETITVGQALGQKNTIFAIWVGQTYLNPTSAIAPGMYVLWQNTINSYQLWKARKEAEKTIS